jgi:hypothetical protein
MGFLAAGDTINGKEGSVFATIDGKVHELMFIKKLEAKVEKQKTDVKVLGYRGVQKKANGFAGTGTMTAYYVSPIFRQMMIDYMKTGVDTYFKIVVTNDDKTTSVGPQRVQLYNVNIDSCILALVDADSDTLEEEIPFTFSDAEILNSFSELSY